jgi:hypothetical protein
MAIDVEKTLKGLDFPADKETILNKARENGAGDDEISVLEELPEKEYGDMAEIDEALTGDDEEMEDASENEETETDDEEM